jgi:hypothetical protein
MHTDELERKLGWDGSLTRFLVSFCSRGSGIIRICSKECRAAKQQNDRDELRAAHCRQPPSKINHSKPGL